MKIWILVNPRCEIWNSYVRWGNPFRHLWNSEIISILILSWWNRVLYYLLIIKWLFTRGGVLEWYSQKHLMCRATHWHWEEQFIPYTLLEATSQITFLTIAAVDTSAWFSVVLAAKVGSCSHSHKWSWLAVHHVITFHEHITASTLIAFYKSGSTLLELCAYKIVPSKMEYDLLWVLPEIFCKVSNTKTRIEQDRL